MEPENDQKTEQKFTGTRTTLWLFVLLFAISIFIYFAGIRFDKDNLRLTLPGSISMSLTEKDAVIIINDTPVKKTGANQDIKLNFIPAGIQKIGIAKEGFWPWIKTINLSSRQNINLEPILISKNPTGEIINSENPDRAFILESLKNNLSLSATSSDGLISIKTDNNFVKAKFHGEDIQTAPIPFCSKDLNGNTIHDTCEPEVIIFSAKEPIRNVAFYKERSDVAIISISNGIFVIELNGQDNENFQPIYKGKKPEFIVDSSNRLFVHDEGALMLIHW